MFVDTSAWFAIFVENDRNAQLVGEWLDKNDDQELITTEPIS